MFRFVVVSSVAALTLWGCGGRQGTPCGGSTCSDQEVCDQALKLCVANVGPKIVIDSPVADLLIGSATFEVRGTITDDNGALKSAEYAVGEGEWSALTVDDRGLFAVIATTPSIDGAATPVKFRATDAASITSETQVTVVIDTVAPRCAVTSPTTGAAVWAANTLTGTIQASIEDGSSVTAEISLDDGATWNPMTVDGAVATYSYPLPASVEYAPFAFALRAEDAAGHSCAVGPVQTYVDTQAPVLRVESPVDGDILSLAAATVNAQFDGGLGGMQLLYRVNGGADVPLQAAAQFPTASFPVDDVDYTPVTLEFIARDSAGNEAVQPRAVFFDRKAPVVTFLSPAADRIFNKQDAADAGNQITTVWTVADGDPQATWELAVGRDSPGTFAASTAYSHTVTVNGGDNGNTYNTTVRATDRGSNLSTSAQAFRVDVVNPGFSVSPGSGSRMTARELRMTFNEPTTFTNPTSALVWDVSGAAAGDFSQLSEGNYAWQNLTAGALYRGTLSPQGNDVAGNPITQVSTFNFFTDPTAPDAGTILVTDAGSLTAAMDQDGVVQFGDRQLMPATAQIRFRWFRVSPTDGNATLQSEHLHGGSSLNYTRLDVWAWAARQPNGDTVRKGGITEFDGGSGVAYYSEGGTPIAVSGADALVLPGAWNNQAPRTGPFDYGVIYGSGGTQTYNRPPNAVITHPFRGNITVGGRLSYVVWRNTMSLVGNPPMALYSFERAVYRCRDGFLGQPPECAMLAAGGVGAVSSASVPSVVLTEDGIAVYVLGYSEVCRREFSIGLSSCNSGSCDHTRTGAGDLTVHPAHDGTRVFGVRTNGANYEILERDLAPTCDSPWTVLFTLPTSAGDRPIPVRFGSTRAALYRDTSGNIRVAR